GCQSPSGRCPGHTCRSSSIAVEPCIDHYASRVRRRPRHHQPSSGRLNVTRHFLCLSDLGSNGIIRLLDSADHYRATRSKTMERPLSGKTVALVFDKASTRTRVALEIN